MERWLVDVHYLAFSDVVDTLTSGVTHRELSARSHRRGRLRIHDTIATARTIDGREQLAYPSFHVPTTDPSITWRAERSRQATARVPKLSDRSHDKAVGSRLDVIQMA